MGSLVLGGARQQVLHGCHLYRYPLYKDALRSLETTEKNQHP
jgi:hypothetical protein